VAPTPLQKPPQTSPIFISDKVTLHVSREKDGKSGLVYARIGRWQGRPAWRDARAAVGERTMSHEFDGLDATEKAGMEAALNRCRGLAAQIESELRNTKREHFVDELLSLADLYTSLECAADVLGQSRQSVENVPAPVVKDLQARNRQRHR
jgi:hypothetical protein